MMPLVSADTNIFVYAADPDAGDRHDRAKVLLYTCARERAVLTQQVLGEYLNVLNKSKYDLATGLELAGSAQRLMRLERTIPDDLLAAFHLAQAARLQFWDAVIITVCRRAKVDLLLTEDLQDGQTFGGLTIVNPFVDTNLNRLEFLLAP